MMRGVLEAHGDPDRSGWSSPTPSRACPSPTPSATRPTPPTSTHTAEELAISLDEVRANFERYGLLDDRVEFLEGWFRDTLPRLARPRPGRCVRLDGDLYESTMDGLTNLYPQLSPGGFLIVDDYGVPQLPRGDRRLPRRARHHRRGRPRSTGPAPSGASRLRSGVTRGRPRRSLRPEFGPLLAGIAQRSWSRQSPSTVRYRGRTPRAGSRAAGPGPRRAVARLDVRPRADGARCSSNASSRTAASPAVISAASRRGAKPA